MDEDALMAKRVQSPARRLVNDTLELSGRRVAWFEAHVNDTRLWISEIGDRVDVDMYFARRTAVSTNWLPCYDMMVNLKWTCDGLDTEALDSPKRFREEVRAKRLKR